MHDTKRKLLFEWGGEENGHAYLKEDEMLLAKDTIGKEKILAHAKEHSHGNAKTEKKRAENLFLPEIQQKKSSLAIRSTFTERNVLTEQQIYFFGSCGKFIQIIIMQSCRGVMHITNTQ
jgi:hypothetical protein